MKDRVKHKRALMLSMGALFFLGFGIALLHYTYENQSVDPRIIKARELYKSYDLYAESNNFKAIFPLLDSIELIYNSIDHYQNSYESGVLHNNRAAAWLSMAIYFDSNSMSLDGVSALSKDSLLALADQNIKQSIQTYEGWISLHKDKDAVELKDLAVISFYKGLEEFSEKQQKRFLKKRVSELEEAQIETPRRLSVAYTNLGIVKRHQERYSEAADLYKKALALWNRNLAAENNLNTLLGKPLKKRSVLEKIFPPDKKD